MLQTFKKSIQDDPTIINWARKNKVPSKLAKKIFRLPVLSTKSVLASKGPVGTWRWCRLYCWAGWEQTPSPDQGTPLPEVLSGTPEKHFFLVNFVWILFFYDSSWKYTNIRRYSSLSSLLKYESVLWIRVRIGSRSNGVLDLDTDPGGQKWTRKI
jgi:hypothetical protein